MLQLSSIFNLGLVINLGYFALIISIVTFLHELGHYIFCRLSDVHVHSFNIGIGPSLYSYKDSRGTIWSFNSVLIAGYVEIANLDKETDDPKQYKTFPQATYWQKMGIMFGGPLANFITAGIILLAIPVDPNNITDYNNMSYIQKTHTVLKMKFEVVKTFSRNGKPKAAKSQFIDFKNMKGPIGLYKRIRDTIKSWTNFVIWLVLLSFGLGLTNLFPVPGLDGYQILDQTVQTITGRPLDSKAKTIIEYTILGALFLLITYKDLFLG